MIDLRPEFLGQVQAILRTYVPNRTVWVFGSRITGATKPHSDLDLVILGSKKLPIETLSALNEAFATSNIPIRIDIVDWNRISEEFQKVIKQRHEEISFS